MTTTPKDSAKRGKHAPKRVVGVCSEANACILVSKRGTLKEVRATESEYSKLCKTPPTYATAFKCQATWTIKKYDAVIELWARANGRAGQENAYEFPPPVDETLFFGDCILVSRKYESGSAAGSAPLTVANWKKIYAHLFGGFDDLVKLADADENEIDELEHISDKKKTRDGYLKDGFIVDDGAARINIKSELHKMKLVAKTKDYADGADSDSEYRENTSDGDDDDDDDDDDDENSPDAVAIKSATANDDSDDESNDDVSDDEAVEIDNDANDDDDDDDDNNDANNDDNNDEDDDDANDDGEAATANEDACGGTGCTVRNQKVRPEIKSKLQLHPSSSSQESVSAGNNSKCNKGNNANNNSNNTYNIITKIKIVRGGKNAATAVQSDPNLNPTSCNPTSCSSTPISTPKSGINTKIKQKQPIKLKRIQHTKSSAAARAAIVAAGTALAASASAKPASLSDTNANASSDASELSEEPYEY